MKITKSKLQQIIREELQEARFGSADGRYSFIGIEKPAWTGYALSTKGGMSNPEVPYPTSLADYLDSNYPVPVVKFLTFGDNEAEATHYLLKSKKLTQLLNDGHPFVVPRAHSYKGMKEESGDYEDIKQKHGLTGQRPSRDNESLIKLVTDRAEIESIVGNYFGMDSRPAAQRDFEAHVGAETQHDAYSGNTHNLDPDTRFEQVSRSYLTLLEAVLKHTDGAREIYDRTQSKPVLDRFDQKAYDNAKSEIFKRSEKIRELGDELMAISGVSASVKEKFLEDRDALFAQGKRSDHKPDRYEDDSEILPIPRSLTKPKWMQN